MHWYSLENPTQISWNPMWILQAPMPSNPLVILHPIWSRWPSLPCGPTNCHMCLLLHCVSESVTVQILKA